MYICICKAVSTKEVDEVVRLEGPSLEQVSSSCGAGTACGSCRLRLMRYLSQLQEANLTPVKAAPTGQAS
jgi:bacterioferritin-associated ferredoxin